MAGYLKAAVERQHIANMILASASAVALRRA